MFQWFFIGLICTTSMPQVCLPIEHEGPFQTFEECDRLTKTARSYQWLDHGDWRPATWAPVCEPRPA